MTEQLALDQLHTCPTCDGTGRRPDREHDGTCVCGVCQGSGTIDYDPDDRSIPFG